ncbi:MAG: hypothetical protein OQK98_06620 [Gammaproteobacteria bacterium]|nr:hypothetical protein [Gammaproteobacteria bacterium]
MKSWFSKNLGDAMLAYEPLADLEKCFLSISANAGNANEMAVFIRHESEGRLHCEVKVYFSPALAVVAREFDAEPCVKPSPDGLGLFAGSEDSWLLLFPEGNP